MKVTGVNFFETQCIRLCFSSSKIHVWLYYSKIFHDLLFLPISTMESRVS